MIKLGAVRGRNDQIISTESRERRCDFADAVITFIRDKQVALRVGGYAPRKTKTRRSRHTTIAAETRDTIARHGGDNAIRTHLTDALIKGGSLLLHRDVPQYPIEATL